MQDQDMNSTMILHNSLITGALAGSLALAGRASKQIYFPAVVEVMGKDVPFPVLAGGLFAGASAVSDILTEKIIPEVPIGQKWENVLSPWVQAGFGAGASILGASMLNGNLVSVLGVPKMALFGVVCLAGGSWIHERYVMPMLEASN